MEHTSPCENLIIAIKDIEGAKMNIANIDERQDRHHEKMEVICLDINNIKIKLAVITFASSCIGAIFGGLISKVFESGVGQLVFNFPK